MTTKNTSEPKYDIESAGRVAGLSKDQSTIEVLVEDANGHRTVHRVSADSEAAARKEIEQRLGSTKPPRIVAVGRSE
jgi:hypothetical protein